LSDQGQKTEQATQQRQQKTRREGRFPSSKEFISAVQFVCVLIVAQSAGAGLARDAGDLCRTLFRYAFSGSPLTPNQLVDLVHRFISPVLFHFFLAISFVFAAVLVVQLASTGFGMATKQLMPDVKRLDPKSKLLQMPKENAGNALRALFLLGFVVWFLKVTLNDQVERLAETVGGSLALGIGQAISLTKLQLQQLAAVLVIFGVTDFFRQRKKFTKSQRMTKQEVRDEAKESEGNPQMKMRIRRLQRDAARRSMIKAVPTAAAIIVNPTHYAIAIRYEMGTRAVPTVIAKGKNYLAQMIRQHATEHGVPIIENKPLAQALYQAVDVGQEIPPDFYRAVAEVLAQIYRILNRQ
jgi:flagellar biosynthesis protein FlhB